MRGVCARYDWRSPHPQSNPRPYLRERLDPLADSLALSLLQYFEGRCLFRLVQLLLNRNLLPHGFPLVYEGALQGRGGRERGARREVRGERRGRAAGKGGGGGGGGMLCEEPCVALDDGAHLPHTKGGEPLWSGGGG